jgi:hypothetical protein
MTPAVGQRWLWNMFNKSIVIIEITNVEVGCFHYIYVQVIKKYYPKTDIIGTEGQFNIEMLTSQYFTYLRGQDKII